MHAIHFNSLTGEWEVMTRGAAWHGLGQVVQGAQTWEDTMRLAGLNWSVSRGQLEYRGLDVPAYGIFRDDYLAAGEIDKAFISPTTETYEILQNDYMFAFLDAIVEDEGAHYESAGSLNNGAQVWALVNLHTAFEIGGSGDRFENYLCFTEDRTGQRAAKCFVTTVRVVCANTLQMAYSGSNNESAAGVTFRHTKNMHFRMEQAIDAFTGAKQTIETLRLKLNRLADRVITRDTLEEALDRLFPLAKGKTDSAVRSAKMLEVVKLFESNDDNQFPEVRGTAYNLLNAATEYVDHFSAVRRTGQRVGQTDEQIRFERAMFGSGADFKLGAIDMLLEVTSHAPIKGSAVQNTSAQMAATKEMAAGLAFAAEDADVDAEDEDALDADFIE